MKKTISLIYLCLIVIGSAHAQRVFVVNSTSDEADMNYGDGVCETDEGECTLRAAIEEANSFPNGDEPDEIHFTDIPITSGRAVITLMYAHLPAISEAVNIKGGTAQGDVVLNGENTMGLAGIHLGPGSDGSTIRKLTIGNFPLSGILIDSDNNKIQKNYIGTNAAGADAGNGFMGIYLTILAQNNLIGGIDNGNVIGFNDDDGIYLNASHDNIIRGNFIGTNPDGKDLGNKGTGVRLVSTSNGSTIGGAAAGQGNVIAFNSVGIWFYTTDDNFVYGNEIRMNDGHGIEMQGSRTGNVIGYEVGEVIGANAARGNTIALNGGAGIFLAEDPAGTNTKQSTIRGNEIYENEKGGIALDSLGDSANDAGDDDDGDNQLQNYPEIDLIEFNSRTGLIDFIYVVPTEKTNADYPITVDFYVADDPMRRQGKSYIGTHDYKDPEETVVFSINPSDTELSEKDFVVATATDAMGNTSEFSVAVAPSGKLPVELTRFDVIVDGTDTILIWETASETNNAGFEIQHRAGQDAPWVKQAFVPGKGTTNELQSYSYRLSNLGAGLHSFRLKQIDFDGTFAYSGIEAVTIQLMDTHAFSEAYPNPFNPQTTFTLAVQQAGLVRISVHDMLGRQVALLHNGNLAPGLTHTFTFEATGLGSGTYLLRIDGGHFAETRRLLLVK